MRLLPIAVLAAAGVLALLAMWGDHELDRSLNAQTEIAQGTGGIVPTGLYDGARMYLFGASAILFVVAIAGAYVVDRRISRRIRQPVLELAELAEMAAAGDLRVSIAPVGSTEEVERVGRALAALVSEMKRLSTGLRDAATDASTMARQIETNAADAAQSAAQIEHTAGVLTSQSGTVAGVVRALTAASNDLVPMAERLDSGTHEGVERNALLRSLALENRGRLEEGSRALDALTDDVQSSADAIASLADASQEIRSFVTLVQKLARQSKMLALNAAMEAARAGDQGEGFAVVATEVRRLSTMSSEAAERTQRVVTDILSSMDASRASAERTVATARAVRGATEQGSASFGQIEAVVADMETWTGSIEQTAKGAHALVRGMTERLDELSQGAEAFAASMREISASNRQRSTTAQEIAGSAAALSRVAARLSSLASSLIVP
jgi:methyl-accepting chemotaxis protein